MNVIFDFDWTLWNPGALKERLTEETVDHWRLSSLWDFYNPADFFYEDSLDWLLVHQKKYSFSVLTAFQGSDYSSDAEQFQKEKVNRSGIDTLVSEVMCMSGLKGNVIAPLLRSGTQNLFIDDTVDQLLHVHEAHPEVVCIQMVRTNNEVCNRSQTIFPVIESLLDLDGIITAI